MKSLEISRVASLPTLAADVPHVLDALNVSFCPIDTVNWPVQYPYRPDAAFRMAWCPDGLLLHYRVSERYVRARYSDDNSDVYTDSCVECFIRNDIDSDYYYNIESSCVGTILVGVGQRPHRARLTLEEMGLVQRWSSLGCVPFEERNEPATWELALIVPVAVFAQHLLTLEEGATLWGNFYKCGDELTMPHYLSWNPIDSENPNFHRPDCFGKIILKG